MHIDFDYFYAQCEEVRNPMLKTKPVCVCVYSERGGDSGAIATANYLARKYGVKSGMPIHFAKRRLAEADGAEFIPVDFDYYTQISEDAMETIRQFADTFEYIGRDEAYLDVSERTSRDYGAAARLAQEIKNTVRIKTKLTSSIGVSPNKMISKIASDFEKPDGLTVIRPAQTGAFLDPLGIRDIPGIGKKTESRLAIMGLRTIGQLRSRDLFALTSEFGRKSGTYIYNAARGIDEDPVRQRAPRIQHGRIVTLSEDSVDYEFLRKRLGGICADIHDVIMGNNQTFKSVGVHVVQSDMTARSKSRMLKNTTASKPEMLKVSEQLLSEMLKAQEIPIRRLGVRVTELSDVRGQSDITSFF